MSRMNKRIFECKKCTSDSVAKKFRATFEFIECAAGGLLECSCKECGYQWTETPSDKLEKHKDNGEYHG